MKLNERARPGHVITRGGPAIPAVSAGRCLAVWLCVTALAAAGTALGVAGVGESLDAGSAPATIDVALVRAAGVGAALLCPWLWLVATLSVRDALRGRVTVRSGWTRRITLLACGVAVATTVVSPTHAAPSASAGPPRGEQTSPLSGLPYPDRPSSTQDVDDRPATSPPLPVSRTAQSAEPNQLREEDTEKVGKAKDTATARPSVTAEAPPGPREHRVRAGDTLWAIAATTTSSNDPSHPAVSGADLAEAVEELHRRNRRVIGDNPDLIRPGQVLDLHSEGDEPR